MSRERSPGDGSGDRSNSRVSETRLAPSTGSLILKFLYAARIPIALTVLSVLGIIGMLVFGVPWRSLALLIVTLCLVVPIVAVYGLAFAFFYLLEQRIPLVERDDEHNLLGISLLSPGEFQRAEIEGDGLTKRTGANTNRDVYVCEGVREVGGEGDPGEDSHLVLTGTWELEEDAQTVAENWEEFGRWKDDVLPLVVEGVRQRAGKDVDVLQNTDALGHGLLLGAEQDSFIEGDVDPFDWDLSPDERDLGDFDLSGRDRDGDGADGGDDRADQGDRLDLDGAEARPDVAAPDGGEMDG